MMNDLPENKKKPGALAAKRAEMERKERKNPNPHDEYVQILGCFIPATPEEQLTKKRKKRRAKRKASTTQTTTAKAATSKKPVARKPVKKLPIREKPWWHLW